MNLEIRKHRDALASEFAELIHPELRRFDRGGPFIILASETGLECCGDFYGMTSPKMASWLCDEIPTRQNGPAMLMNDSQILTDCGGCFETAMGILTAVACHELTHCLQVPGLCDDATPVSWEPTAFRRFAGTPSPITKTEELRERPQHGPEFIRLTLHIRHRLQERGWRVPLGELLQWSRFAYVQPEWHCDALKEDFERCIELPLSLVPEIPEPLAFRELFDESLSTFEGFMGLVRSFSKR